MSLKSVLATIEATSATNPAGATVTMQSYPIVIEASNSMACRYTTNGLDTGTCSAAGTAIGGQIQYVYPLGTTGAAYIIPAYHRQFNHSRNQHCRAELLSSRSVGRSGRWNRRQWYAYSNVCNLLALWCVTAILCRCGWIRVALWS